MQGKRERTRRWWVALVLTMGALACSPVIEGGGIGTGGSGVACLNDEDCVPNACCGEGNGVVSASQAPDCSAVQCNRSCPVNQVNCGCGLPVCRNGRCAIAVTSGPGCP